MGDDVRGSLTRALRARLGEIVPDCLPSERARLVKACRLDLASALRQYAELVDRGTEPLDALDALGAQLAKSVAEVQSRTGRAFAWERAFAAGLRGPAR